jgi:hypothetical protein
MRRLRSQAGVSMAEVMIAMLVLALGSLAVLNLIGASAHSSFRNQQSQAVSDRLQEEIERIQHLPYEQIALSGVPASSASQSSPAWRVQGTSYAVNRNGTQAAPLVYNGSALDGGGTVCDASHDCGVVDPTPTPFTDGNVSGTIYRYVVWQNDATCPDTSCPGSQDLKRIIIAIALDTTAAGGVHPYQEIQTQVSDPTATHGTTPTPPRTGCTGGSDCSGTQCVGSVCAGGTCNGSNCTFPTPWTFWLTDTSCNNTSRQALVGDHLLHSTDGNCSSGTKDSSNCSTVVTVTTCPAGAPDLMVTNPPTLTTETPLYNYSTDLSPAHKGLIMPKPSSTIGNGCSTNSLFQPLTSLGSLLPDPDTTRMQTIHKWLSNPMGTGFNISLTGDATLDLWTKSVDGVAYSGNLCVWLFTRTVVAGLPVDAPVTTFSGNTGAAAPLSCSGSGLATAFQCSETTWPTGWTELHIPLKFNIGVALGPTTQLGLALQVERAGTSGGGLNFLYDEPSFDSRLQINSVTPALPF